MNSNETLIGTYPILIKKIKEKDVEDIVDMYTDSEGLLVVEPAFYKGLTKLDSQEMMIAKPRKDIVTGDVIGITRDDEIVDYYQVYEVIKHTRFIVGRYR